MLVTNTIDDLLMCFIIVDKTQCLIFLHHVSDGYGHLVFVCLCLRSDCIAKHWSRILDIRITDNSASCAQCIICICGLQFDNCTDITCKQLTYTDLILAVNDIDLTNLFCNILFGVVNLRVTVKNTGHNLQIGNLTDKRINDCLEHKCRQCFIFICFHIDCLSLCIQSLYSSLFCIGREEFSDQIKQTGDTCLLYSRSTVYRMNITIADTDSQSLCDFVFIKLFTREELFHQIIICHGDCFCNLSIIIFYLTFNGCRYFLRFIRFVIIPCFSSEDIDRADNLTIFNDRKFEQEYGLAELFSEFFDHLGEVCIFIIQFVNKEDGWNTGMRCLLPCAFCSCFHTVFCGNNDQSIVTHHDTSVFFTFIVTIAWCINEIDLAGFPFNRREMAVYGNASLAFFHIKVNSSCSIRCLTESVNLLIVIEYGFNQRTLAGTGMTQDNDISYFICTIVFHGNPSLQNVLEIIQAFLADIVNCHVAFVVLLILVCTMLEQLVDKGWDTDIRSSH